jgi:hypothetical protein
MKQHFLAAERGFGTKKRGYDSNEDSLISNPQQSLNRIYYFESS